jgi:hypothetical protein
MQIQPITTHSQYAPYYRLKSEKSLGLQSNQPNFKGVKGLIKGAATGAGITAAGVALIAGPVAVPLFAGYIAVNGAIAALAGHFIENQNDKPDSKKS